MMHTCTHSGGGGGGGGEDTLYIFTIYQLYRATQGKSKDISILKAPLLIVEGAVIFSFILHEGFLKL